MLKSSKELLKEVPNYAFATERLNQEIAKGRAIIDADRNQPKYSNLLRKLLDLVKSERIVISSADVLLSKNLSELKLPLEIHSNRGLHHAKSIADLVYASAPNNTGRFSKMRTISANAEFRVEYDSTRVAEVHHVGPFRGAKFRDMINPVGISGIWFLPAEIEIVEWCRERSSLDTYDLWQDEEFIARGKKLFSDIKGRIANRVIGGSSSASSDEQFIYEVPFLNDTKEGGGFAKKHKPKPKNRVSSSGLLDVVKNITSDGKSAVVGEYAHCILSGKSGDGARMQIITSLNISEFMTKLRKELPQFELRNVSFNTDTPRHYSHNFWVIYAGIKNDQRAIMEVYDFPTREIVPCHRQENGLTIAGKWVNMRVLFLTLWKLRLVYHEKRIGIDIYRRRLKRIWDAIVFMDSRKETQASFIGVYTPSDIVAKIRRSSQTMYFPYYPAASK